MENFIKENDYETSFDALVDFINHLPKARVKMINPARYVLMMHTSSQLTKMLRKHNPEGEITIELNEMLKGAQGNRRLNQGECHGCAGA